MVQNILLDKYFKKRIQINGIWMQLPMGRQVAKLQYTEIVNLPDRMHIIKIP